MVIDLNGHFISIVVEVNESVVQEESAVALLAITIVHLVSSLDVLNGFDNEPLLIVGIGPGSLSWSLMIKHVSISNETISFYSFYLNTKDTTGDHHSHL